MYNTNIVRTLELKFENIDSTVYMELYDHIADSRIKTLLSKFHSEYIESFKLMNTRLPTKSKPNHFWANSSRRLIDVIESTFELIRATKKTEYAFYIDEYYRQIINKCNDFLVYSGGSEIPENTNKITLYYEKPIFLLNNSITITRAGIEEVVKRNKLKLVGEGSYAKVFKYKDSFYNKHFILKSAKKNLNEKEIERFKNEYKTLKELNSPYIVEVYKFDSEHNEYVMEYADFTLKDYIEAFPHIDMKERQNIGLQIIKGLEYLHSKEVLHRDLSFTNVLIKKYDTIPVVKLSDFGLVKTIDSTLTSLDTELKGSLNDPDLRRIGFKNYGILHEIYALTILLNFVITGRKNIDNISERTKKFVDTGTNPDSNKRFQTLLEIKGAFIEITNDEQQVKGNSRFNFIIDKRDIDIYTNQKENLVKVKQKVVQIAENPSAYSLEDMLILESYLTIYGNKDPVNVYRDKDLKNNHNNLLDNLNSFYILINDNKSPNSSMTFKFKTYDIEKEKMLIKHAKEIVESYTFITERLEKYI
ncbi:protein kinase family protein [Staphylococcus sp. GDY8P126P]|uniref:protein kinase family protein n=1 Tax=Staphylococcus TaxID=1279 RepID=UPI001AEBBA64|nr:protein kinase family protein [Staphylococcus sp. GDY8P126P]